MFPVFRKLALGVLLLAAASAALWWMDRRPVSAQRQKTARVAIVQFISNTLLNDVAAGAVQSLNMAGFVEGRNLQITRYNAEGDQATLSTLARQVVQGQYDLILSVSTLALQALASANREARIPTVFGAVTDPVGAGVGITRLGSLEKPRHLTGFATCQPVGRCFEIARLMRPELKLVGVAWNPSEQNAEFQLKLARAHCRQVGIKLEEATVDSTAGVPEAIHALLGRGVEAIWVPGDNVMNTACPTVIAIARDARVPVFTTLGEDVRRGALFGAGGDYRILGQAAGELAARVLRGTPPADLPVENYMPLIVGVNTKILATLRDPWQAPASLVESATIVMDEQGERSPATRPAPGSASRPSDQRLDRVWNIYGITFADNPMVEAGVKGFLTGLQRSGLVEGRDYRFKMHSANLDMVTLGSILDSAAGAQPDLVLVTTTNALQAAVRRFDQVPVLFTVVADPLITGAGRSATDHRPNVTGVTSAVAYAEMARIVRRCLPQARRVGTLFCPGESNSLVHRERWEKALAGEGIELVGVPINAATEMAEGARNLCSRSLDAVGQITDNTSSTGMRTLLKAADQARLPVFAFISEQVRMGAVLALARDFEGMGEATARLAVRVMQGEKTSALPFEDVQQSRLIINQTKARELGITIPADLMQKADEVLK